MSRRTNLYCVQAVFVGLYWLLTNWKTREKSKDFIANIFYGYSNLYCFTPRYAYAIGRWYELILFFF